MKKKKKKKKKKSKCEREREIVPPKPSPTAAENEKEKDAHKQTKSRQPFSSPPRLYYIYRILISTLSSLDESGHYFHLLYSNHLHPPVRDLQPLAHSPLSINPSHSKHSLHFIDSIPHASSRENRESQLQITDLCPWKRRKLH